MSTGHKERIAELVREKMDGKSYTDIRKELAESGLSSDEIRVLIRQVDEQVLSETTQQGSRERTRQWYRVGLIVAVIGLILSIAYNVGLILANFPALLVYSPFVAGILLMFYGRALQRKQHNPAEKDPGAIRKRRPYT